MAVNLTINGTPYSFPNTGDETWGTNVTNWATAVSAYLLQRTGGSFPLTADIDFGSSFGLVVAYLKSKSTNPSGTGVIRLANTDTINFRNNANSADLTGYGVNSSNAPTFNGNAFLLTLGALSVSRALVTDGAGAIATATTTAAEIGFVNGVTSSIQTQLNAKSTPTSTDTFTNKKLTDASCTFADDGDLTKQLAFQCSGITTATTRTVTMIDADVTIVGLTNAQTLTNKTLTAANLNNPVTKFTTTAKTTTYTILSTDSMILASASGGAFTITLPAASASVGLLFRIKKTDSTFNAVTIARAGSDTISDVAASLTSTTLNSQGEQIEIFCDTTATWQILDRRIPSVVTAYTATFGGFTAASPEMWYQRIGDSLHIKGCFITNSLVASQAQIGLPSGLLTDNTGKFSLATYLLVGYSTYNIGTGSAFAPTIVAEGNVAYVYAGGQNTSLTGSTPQNGNAIFQAGAYYEIFCQVPIKGWNG